MLQECIRKFFENTVAEIIDRMGEYSELKLRRVLANSKMLSCDVSAAFDPMYESVYEKENTAYFGRGIIFNKYTGGRGKRMVLMMQMQSILHI